MKKAGRGWWLGICLWALVGSSTFPSGAHAATCTVGDLSKGYWKRIANPAGCTIPGPPAADSPWPDSTSAQGYPYRIEGKYKLTVYMSADGFSWTIPPARPECITGLAEAYTVVACARYQSEYPEPQQACCRTTYTATGTICTSQYTDSRYGYGYNNYVRYFDVPFMLEEWVWTNKDCANEPPPAPTNTPNPDPGKPDCPPFP